MFCGLAVVERGDDVPGRAPIRHQIERREHARDVERLVVAGRIGRAEAEPLGRHAHDGEHGDGVELHAADAVRDRVRVVAPVHVGHRQAVVEEAEMELAVLQHAADMPVVVRRPGIGARLRVAPGAREVRAVLRLQEGDQGHLAHRDTPRRRNPPYSFAIFFRISTERLPSGVKSALRISNCVGADLLDAVAAEAHQAVGVALVDDEVEILDRARPVGAGLEDVVDALFAVGRAEFALVGFAQRGRWWRRNPCRCNICAGSRRTSSPSPHRARRDRSAPSRRRSACTGARSTVSFCAGNVCSQ